jgi:aerobic carbon-monoxide dehydrogenase medium subunit
VAGDEPREVRRDAAIIPVKFEYLAPATLEEAIALLAGHAGASVIAGGQSLVPSMTTRRTAPSLLVDVRRIKALRGISAAGASSDLHVGAATTLTEIAGDKRIRSHFTALAEAAEAAGDPQVRNRATIGGSLADGHPAGDIIAAALALDAVITLTGPSGAREVAAADFVTGPYETARKAGEIVTGIVVPAPPKGGGSAYVKQRHPGSGYAICGVAAAVTVHGGTMQSARIAVTGAIRHPARLEGAEEAAAGTAVDQAAAAIEAAVIHSRLHFTTDLAASAAYRKHLAGVLAGRAVVIATQRSGAA